MFRGEFTTFSYILNSLSETNPISEKIDGTQLGIWTNYDKYLKGIEYLLKSDFKKAKEILKETIYRIDFEYFALVYFIASYLDDTFDLKEYEEYVNKNGIKNLAYLCFEEIVKGKNEEAKKIFEKLYLESCFVIDYAMYFALIDTIYYKKNLKPNKTYLN